MVAQRNGTNGQDSQKFNKIQRVRQRRFIDAFIDYPSITKAAEATKVDRSLHYKWLEQDDWYKEEFEKIQSRIGDLLESEAYRRAVEGYEEITYEDGKEKKRYKKFSDSLLALLLKANKPDKYAERHENKKTEHHIHEHRWDLSKLTDQELEKLEKINKKATSDRT